VRVSRALSRGTAAPIIARVKKSRSVRARLLAIVVATMLPVAAFSVLVGVLAYQGERQRFKDSLAESARALALLVEREIAARELVLATLAMSPTLTRHDLAAFHEYAQAAVPGPGRVVTLSDLSGRQLLNTRKPYGTTGLPPTAFGERRRSQPQGTLVSPMYFAPIGGQWSFAVDVPVVRDGRVMYYLTMGGFVDQLQQLLAEDEVLHPSWIGSIVDSRGTVVARTLGAEQVVGRPVTPDLLARFAAAPQGAFETTAVDGRRVFSTYSTSRSFGWRFVIGVPMDELAVPWPRVLGVAAAAGLLLALCLLGAMVAGRGISRPLLSLARSSRELREGQPVARAPTGLAEADEVQLALAEAGDALRAAAQQQQARVDAALAEAARAQQAVIQKQRLEAVGHLTGGVAHDFNNLLMVVSNNTHLLKLQHPALRDSPTLAGIERATATGARLTRQLLTFAKRQHVQPERVELQRQLPLLADLVRPTLRGDVQLQCEVAPATPAVCVDLAELELALINLAVNARDAMPDGGRLVLRAGPAPDGSGAVQIEVVDTGVGIPPDQQQQVFEPFFTTKPVGHGTGLGLSQVWGFATQAGGSVSLCSRPGAGTTVRLLLPAAAPDAATRRLPAAAAASDMRVPEGWRVLLVEDNPELAAVTREVLAAAGCLVSTAGSADAAQAALDAPDPGVDAVLSDVRMPGRLSGLGLARWLQGRHPGLPVVLMTGYSEELRQAREDGHAVVHKPCAPDALLAALAAARSAGR
jgi:signal transduction histidine kinase/CheY-like chemotaxis protein